MAQIRLKIISPQGIKVNDMVDIVTIKTLEGYIGLLRGHVPFVSTIVPSQMSYRINNQQHILHISGGIVQSSQDYVKIIAEFIETDDERQAKIAKSKSINQRRIH